MEHCWNDTDRVKLKFWYKKCTSVCLFTTNPVWAGLGLYLDPYGGRLAGNCLRHGLGPEWPFKGCNNKVRSARKR
jgi:hypothetical protein